MQSTFRRLHAVGIATSGVALEILRLGKHLESRLAVYVEYGASDDPGSFSVWQRSAQISDWIPATRDLPSKGGKTIYAGEIEITDEIKTITLRKKSDDTSVRIFSFQFEKIE